MAEKRVILRHPGGDCTLEYSEKDNTIVQKFINWILEYKHYSNYDESNCVFLFEEYKFVLACKIKWRKLGLRYIQP